jgi:hypothetical protein
MEPTMEMNHAARWIVVGAVLVGSAAGTSPSESHSAPRYLGPFNAGGPYRWCPGDDRTGGPGRPFFMNPPNWDWSVCHTYYVVQAGKGNVAPGIWDGDNPPLPPPGPPPPWAP